MQWATWMEWLIPILSAILSGGGIWALLSARAAARSTERAAEVAAKAVERAAEAAANATERAAALAAEPGAHKAATADWASLMSYWQGELNTLRENANRLEVRIGVFEQQREDDLTHIEDLYQHIWEHKPPPPPPRRQATPPGSISGAFTITPEGNPPP